MQQAGFLVDDTPLQNEYNRGGRSGGGRGGSSNRGGEGSYEYDGKGKRCYDPDEADGEFDHDLIPIVQKMKEGNPLMRMVGC